MLSQLRGLQIATNNSSIDWLEYICSLLFVYKSINLIQHGGAHLTAQTAVISEYNQIMAGLKVAITDHIAEKHSIEYRLKSLTGLVRIGLMMPWWDLNSVLLNFKKCFENWGVSSAMQPAYWYVRFSQKGSCSVMSLDCSLLFKQYHVPPPLWVGSYPMRTEKKKMRHIQLLFWLFMK